MFEIVSQFEKQISQYFGSPYCVATDCCTHSIELCLIYDQIKKTECPTYTYLSVPMTFEKLGIEWNFSDIKWINQYQLPNTRIYDSAVLWSKNSYIENTLMCLSFQFRKHLGLGRGGAILCSTKEEYISLKKMSYDGRLPCIPWADQDIDSLGYHYYMTPETAKLGLEKFNNAVSKQPKIWSWKDYPNISKMKIFYSK